MQKIFMVFLLWFANGSATVRKNRYFRALTGSAFFTATLPGTLGQKVEECV
jgi:hypothetical protein